MKTVSFVFLHMYTLNDATHASFVGLPLPIPSLLNSPECRAYSNLEKYMHQTVATL